MSSGYGKVETPEEERMRICNKTISGKHFWHQIAYNKWWTFTTRGDQPEIGRVDQCVACGIVNDISVK